MKVITGKRGSGKIHKLLQLCSEDENGVFVCMNREMVNMLRRICKEYNYNINEIICFEDYAGRGGDNVYIDNVDMLLYEIQARVNNIKAITITDGEERY